MADFIDPAPRHGGDLAFATARYGAPVGGWLDLSTGINPRPYADTAIAPEALTRLPQSAAMDELLAAARRCYRVPDGAAVVAAPGSQALLQWLPTLAQPSLVAVVAPTYSEHARAWAAGGTAAGHRMVEVAGLADAAAADVIVVVNPNNPDGRIFPAAELLDLARGRAGRGGFLVVDEAFADVAPDASVVPRLGDAPVVALRSFGKFFGLAGLRLGFAVGAPALIAGLERKLGPWAVSGPAVEIGARALADDAWIAATRTGIGDRRRRLDHVLAAAGLDVVGGTDLFRLVDDARAADVFIRLGRAGILVRDFADRPTWLRFGVPGRDADLGRLQRALSSAGPS